MKILRKSIIAVVWLLIWQGIAALVDNSILLVGPVQTVKAILRLVKDGDFWITIGCSTANIAAGFVLALAIGIVCAVIAYKWKLFEEFIRVPMTVLKTVPVVCFIVILLVLLGKKHIAMYVVLSIVLPQAYFEVLAGLKTASGELLEMARMYEFTFRKKLRYIFFPGLKKHLSGSLTFSMGMAWKSGVAAEVIAQTANSIGNAIYRSKIYLETDGIFAWTVILILVSYGLEKIVKIILNLNEEK